MGIRATRFLVVGLLLVGVLVAPGCRPKPSATIVPDAALMPLIPADTLILTGVRMTELKKTPVYRKLMAENKLPQIDEFAKETGIDPRKDIWEIILASNGKTTIALVRGQFTEGGIAGSGLEPRLEKEGARRFPYKGYTLTGYEKMAVTFLNSSVAVAGPTDVVRGVIDARDGSKGGPPKELIAKLKEISSSNEWWMISNAEFHGAVPEGLGNVLGGLKNMPVDVRGLVATLDLSSGVKLEATMKTGDAVNAQKLNDAARGVIGMARLTTKDQDRDLLKFYDAVEITRKDATLHLKADMPMAMVEKLLAMYGPRRG